MFGRIICFGVLFSAVVAAAHGDTLTLIDGVSVDGKVTQLPDGMYQLEVKGRTLFYRPDEVQSLEMNEKTGVIDRQAAIEAWKRHEQELTTLTGLDPEQRRRVEPIVDRLQLEEERVAARNELIGIHKELDLFKYLQFRFEEASHRLSPWILEAMCYLDSSRALPLARDCVLHPYFGTRAKAIEMLGAMKDVSSAPLIARGLVDHKPEVQYLAAAALGALGAKPATPALIEMLASADPRVRTAARDSLLALWAPELGETKPETPDQWQQVWTAHSATVGQPITTASLLPLVEPGMEFQNE